MVVVEGYLYPMVVVVGYLYPMVVVEGYLYPMVVVEGYINRRMQAQTADRTHCNVFYLVFSFIYCSYN